MKLLRRIGAVFAPGYFHRLEQRAATRDMVGSFARAFNAAHKDRLTRAHWGTATNANVNADLAADLPTMRKNARFERQNNGILEGMVASHTLDKIGLTGPKLQLTSKNRGWCAKAESIWDAWWKMPDFNGQMSGVDFLSQNNRMVWDNGEYLNQIVTDPAAMGPVKMRLLAIHPRRMDTPPGWYGDQTVTLGVRRDRPGRPRSYFIDDLVENQIPIGTGLQFTEISAQYMIHGYAITEPNQARGIPRLASCLNVVAQLRDFETDVMQAARMAAMLAVLLTTTNGAQDPIVLDGGMGSELEGGMMTALPPGYSATQITPQQPGNTYETFRNAKMAEIGRPACMPLMTIQLDSADHSYASARFDDQSYNRALKGEQAAEERVFLNRVLGLVLLEAQRAGALGATPADLISAWVWMPRPHVDPVKETVAQGMRLADKTQTQAGACAEYGLDAEQVNAQLLRENLEADAEIVARVLAIQDEIDKARAKNPNITLTWAQVLSAAGAAKTPAAYLTAVGRDVLAGDSNDEAGAGPKPGKAMPNAA